MFLHTTEPLTPVSSRDYPHILCACRSTLSNSSSATRIHGQLLLLKHAQIHCLRLRLHRQPDLCTSIIIMHSRNSNSLPYFRAEEHWTNFPLLYAAQTRHGNLFWLCLFIGNALVNLKNMKENVFVLPAVPLSIFSSIKCKNKMKFELLGAFIQIPNPSPLCFCHNLCAISHLFCDIFHSSKERLQAVPPCQHHIHVLNCIRDSVDLWAIYINLQLVPRRLVWPLPGCTL